VAPELTGSPLPPFAYGLDAWEVRVPDEVVTVRPPDVVAVGVADDDDAVVGVERPEGWGQCCKTI
jgi:hypothetical protein